MKNQMTELTETISEKIKKDKEHYEEKISDYKAKVKYLEKQINQKGEQVDE